MIITLQYINIDTESTHLLSGNWSSNSCLAGSILIHCGVQQMIRHAVIHVWAMRSKVSGKAQKTNPKRGSAGFIGIPPKRMDTFRNAMIG